MRLHDDPQQGAVADAAMLIFESLLGLLLAAVVLATIARKVDVPYPVLLALGGAALAFVPGMPRWTLQPELALALFIAPVLLDAAFDSSPRDLKDNWVPLTGLVFAAVGLTTVAVALVARALIPEMPWAVAIALGAIVAPPDAAAATAVLRQARLPHRLLTILEGESLLNDASSLLIYRVAVGAALSGMAGGGFSVTSAAPLLVYALVGSVVFGYAGAWLVGRTIPRMHDAPTAIIVQFGTTFGMWIAAERLGLSGILTIVVYAIVIARTAPLLMSARLRVPSFAVWETVVFVLNVLAFVLIGLQIRHIWDRLEASSRASTVVFALTILATVIVVRIVWVISYYAVVRWRMNRVGFHPPRPMVPPTFKGGIVISWCGMRGIVTLAAAYALPEAGENGQGGFPFRDPIILTAFAVVIGTLIIQGLTIKPLIARLRLVDDDPVGREFEQARVAAYAAALQSLEGERSSEADALRRKYDDLRRRAEHGPDAPSDAAEAKTASLRQRAIDAARQAAHAMREREEIGDAAFRRLEIELDWQELIAEQSSGSR